MNNKEIRPCQFCFSRSLACQPVEPSESQPVGYWRVECLFCHGIGPQALSSEEAWNAWSGNVFRAPAHYGTADVSL